MRRRRVLFLAIAALVFAATGCSPEGWSIEECKESYSLIEESECPPPDDGGGTPGGPTGPMITLEQGSSSSAPVKAKVDGTEQTDSTESVHPSDPWEVCELRQDFIGTKILKFNYYTEGSSTPVAAEFVTISGTDHLIEIRRTTDNKIHWTIKERTGLLRVCAGPNSQASYTAGELPSEFFSLDSSSMSEDKADVDIVKVEIQVQEP